MKSTYVNLFLPKIFNDAINMCNLPTYLLIKIFRAQFNVTQK